MIFMPFHGVTWKTLCALHQPRSVDRSGLAVVRSFILARSLGRRGDRRFISEADRPRRAVGAVCGGGAFRTRPGAER